MALQSRTERIVVDPCFIHRHTNAFLVDCEQLRHSSCIELYHAQMCMQNIDDMLIEMDSILAISRAFTFESFKTIARILSINSGAVISFGRPGLYVVSVLARPQRSLVNHF